jgi:PAS domain S-box-containing protein
MMGLPKTDAVERGGPAEAGLRRDLASRLIAEQPISLLGQLGVLAVTTTLLWSEEPHAALLIWSGALVAITLARGILWYHGRAGLTAERLLLGIRVGSSVTALTWGAGAAVLVPHLSPEYVALVLLAFCGLSAGATSTLAADLITFRLFIFGILSPLLIVILLGGNDRFHVAAACLVALFAAFTLQLHRRTYRVLVERLRSVAELERNYRENNREHLFLDALFASVPNAIAVVDRDTVCHGANPGFEALFGFAPKEVLGQRLFDVLVPAAELPDARQIRQQVLLGETVVTEGQRRRKDGTLVTVRVSAAPVLGDEGDRILLLYTDMTEIRDTEAVMRATQAHLEMVLASSTAVIYVTRVDGRNFIPSWVSANLTRLTGYSVREALAPDWWQSHLHPDDRDRVLAALPRLLTEGQLTIEYRFRQKDDRVFWMRDEAHLVLDAAGKPKEIFGTWLDVTDLKLAEAAMREGRDMAERSARSRAEFLANMSHEIRTPMNAVLGLTELLLDTEMTAEQARSLRMVQSAGETLLTLLNDILDLSKIEAEHLSLESIPFDLRYLLESTVTLLSVRAVDRPVDLMADVAGDLPHLVLGDPTRLRQVLSNLVGNALKFTDRGEVVLSATVTGDGEGRSVIRFAVRDTGIGIAADKQAAVFEEFTQADASMTRRYGGTGLGLAIARRLVRLMGGELTLVSELGRGSEFAFSLPMPIETGRPTPALDPAALAGRRMLVVDDNATNRRVICAMLGPAQVTVDEAASSAEGLDAIRRAREEGHPYSLAFIDAQMPDRDGFDLAADIRDDPSIAGTIRLLMLTSAGQRGDSQRCREVGIDGYLMKPLSRSDLLEATASLLGAGEFAPRVEVVTRHSIAESRTRLRILLAEDNQVNQEVAATMLRKRGHTVTVVNNGREAVDMVAEGGPFDVVLMDIQMPELDGFAATHEIRLGPAGAELPIIALTAHALTGERERCLAQGMNGYVPKPFRPHELFAAVESLGSVTVVPAPAKVPGPAMVASSKAVDLAGFRSIMREAGAEEAVDGILDLFSESAPERLTALGAAVGAGDGVAIGRAAHAFKSPAGSIGAHGLQALLQEMEIAGTAGEIAQARATFARVGPEAESVLECLRVHRGKESKHD